MVINLNALIVGITTKNDKYDLDYSLSELKSLAEVLDYKVLFEAKQNLDTPNSKTYIGSGKLNELVFAIRAYDIKVAIFNDELSPTQLKNIEQAIQIEVIDRSFLILKIFELRAKTNEAMLEVKLAKNIYMLPRLELMKGEESRIGGGLYNKGKGETSREQNRRHLLSEINNIQKKLKQLKEMKKSQIKRRKRNEIPLVSLVGYTNSGKSSTMNTILNYVNSNSNVLEKNQLFSTLETKNKKITINNTSFILTDTVGFVSKLPHGLVNSFYETLEEIRESDLIIIVLDASNKYINTQYNVVLNVLNMLDALNIPTIYLLNKWENTIDENMEIYGKKAIKFSNKTKLNVDLLINEIISEISVSHTYCNLIIPYKESYLISQLEKLAKIINKTFDDYNIYYECEIPINYYYLFKDYDKDNLIS